MRRGFALVELMVVVVIVGILASVAIPGFISYLYKSKTSEAKVNLHSIQLGALTFFQVEHVYDEGMSVTTRLYPYADTVVGIGHPADDTTVAQKFPPGDAEDALATQPWSDLSFVIKSPFYFYYNYDSMNENSPSFQASASASINDPCDAIFIVEGRASGAGSAILDLSGDSSKCNLAVAPTTTPETP